MTTNTILNMNNLIEITEDGRIRMKYGYDRTMAMLTELVKDDPDLQATVTTLTTLSVAQLEENERKSIIRTIDANSRRIAVNYPRMNSGA